MPTDQPDSQFDLSPPDRFLIIPLIVRLPEIPKNRDGKPISRITPDHVIDFYQGMERFSGEFATALRSS